MATIIIMGLLSKSSNKTDEEILEFQENNAILQYEFPSHKRILEDSINLIQTTNNIDTLLSRYDDFIIHYNWIMEQKRKGVPIDYEFHSNGEPFEIGINLFINWHIVRIAQNNIENYKNKIQSLKTYRAKENLIIKSFELIDKCTNALKEHQIKDSFALTLQNLHENIEDLFNEINKTN
jgi:hypothetical protein